jgi:hypothetical protein
MTRLGWKNRLKAGIEAGNKSQREVSLAAGFGAGYVNGMINDDKDATIGHLMAVCRAANLSIYKVLGDFEITQEQEEFLRLLKNADEVTQKSILHLLRSARLHAASPAPESALPNQPETTREEFDR